MIDMAGLALQAARDTHQQLVDELAALDTVIAPLEAYIEVRGPIQQPTESVAVGEGPEPVVSPPGDVAPAPTRHRKETFVCSRCPMTFKTRGWRDRHQAKHPAVPDVAPSGGERIRRIPPKRGFNGSRYPEA